MSRRPGRRASPVSSHLIRRQLVGRHHVLDRPAGALGQDRYVLLGHRSTLPEPAETQVAAVRSRCDRVRRGRRRADADRTGRHKLPIPDHRHIRRDPVRKFYTGTNTPELVVGEAVERLSFVRVIAFASGDITDVLVAANRCGHRSRRRVSGCLIRGLAERSPARYATTSRR
jgi:hypothetical protein